MYRIAYIDCALDYLDNPAVWKMLSDALRLRVQGYRKEYGLNVLPLSKDDFFSTQILIYKDESLVCTYKFTREDLCSRYRVQFPLISVLEEGKTSEYSQVIQSILNHAKAKGHAIAYCGGWTIDPSLRENKESVQTVRELVLATHYDYMKRFGIYESLICGVIKFKAHLFQESIGYKRVQMNGKDIDAVGLAYLDDEPVFMLHMREHNDEAQRIYNKHKDVLDNASVYSRDLKISVKRAA